MKDSARKGTPRDHDESDLIDEESGEKKSDMIDFFGG